MPRDTNDSPPRPPPPVEADSAGVYFMSVEEFEARRPAAPPCEQGDADRGDAPARSTEDAEAP